MPAWPSIGFPMKTTIAIVISVLVLSSGTAEAKGCLKGAVVGGVAGHFAGHHPIVGAAIGCAVGHHHAKVVERRELKYDAHHRYDPHHRH